MPFKHVSKNKNLNFKKRNIRILKKYYFNDIFYYDRFLTNNFLILKWIRDTILNKLGILQ